LFKELLKHPAVSRFFGKAQPVALQSGPAWAGGPMEKTVAAGVVLAGDAAGQLWAAQGGGITPAMVCGSFAGEVAAKAALEGDVSERRLGEYEDKWRSTIGKTLFSHVKAKELLDQVISSDALIEKAVQDIGLEMVGAYVYGTEEYRQPIAEWLKGKV
jgi:digeranylgeranylglycerophospholipid reductase